MVVDKPEQVWPERDFEKAWTDAAKKIADEEKRRGRISPINREFPDAMMHEAEDKRLGVLAQSVDAIVDAQRTIGLQIEFTRGQVDTNLAGITIGNIVEQIRQGAIIAPDQAPHFSSPHGVSVFRMGGVTYVQAGLSQEIQIRSEKAAIIAQIIRDAVWPQSIDYKEILPSSHGDGTVLPPRHRGTRMRSSLFEALQAATNKGLKVAQRG